MQPLQAVRAKDGVFIGNVVAARDASFLSMNKISHIINCAGLEVSNTFQYCGIRYLTLHWREVPPAGNLLDGSSSEGRVVRQIREFIDNCLAMGECVLIHSVRGVNRCCVAAVAYFISKFLWNYENSATYLSLIHPDMAIRPFFARQLRQLSKRLSSAATSSVLSPNPQAVADVSQEGEQMLLRNTYLNMLPYTHPKNSYLRKAVSESEIRKASLMNTIGAGGSGGGATSRFDKRLIPDATISTSSTIDSQGKKKKKLTFSSQLEQPGNTPAQCGSFFDVCSSNLPSSEPVVGILKQAAPAPHFATYATKASNDIPSHAIQFVEQPSRSDPVRCQPASEGSSKVIKQVCVTISSPQQL
eukprot:TRINITY_DN34948_c0_g1_i1.p1 TRINITY_DN34948_c0_g1~~TRINITY_DN34948_c0_g1_i1.p1  ORF type:complete len:358 (+),score=55.33 TRINITY_DN34948_c0_g1_i1:8-1081(+)